VPVLLSLLTQTHSRPRDRHNFEVALCEKHDAIDPKTVGIVSVIDLKDWPELLSYDFNSRLAKAAGGRVG
jgi:hypothetical protein